MSQPFVISSRVLETINALPSEERVIISNALAGELLLGNNPVESLSPFHAMIYSMIRYYVKKDSDSMAEEGCASNDSPSCVRGVAI